MEHLGGDLDVFPVKQTSPRLAHCECHRGGLLRE